MCDCYSVINPPSTVWCQHYWSRDDTGAQRSDCLRSGRYSFPSGPWPPWRRRGESPSEIGSVSLSLSVFPFQVLAFHRFLYSWRSVTPIGLKFEHDFYPDISFLAAKEGHQLHYGVSTRVRGAPPASWPPRASSRVDSTSQNSHIFQKNPVSFYPVWTPFDMDFLRNKKHAKNRNWHWALDQ